MKKNLFFLFALICSMSLFTACSDDDPDYTPVIEEEIAGNYKGVLGVSINGQQVAQNIPQRISVSGAGATSINLSLTNFSFSGIQVGDVALQNCPMTQNGNTYDFTGATNLNITGLTASVNATGNIGNGTVSITMDIDATLGTVEQTVVVTYTGTKLSGTEGTGAEITGFTFGEGILSGETTIGDNTITFNVLDGVDITKLAPTITVSEGATITPASGVEQDFTKPVTYTVVSEDYGTTKTYTVSVSGRAIVYNFEDWTVDTTQTVPENQYPIAEGGWASCNAAVMLIKSMGILGGITYTGDWPVKSTTDAYAGTSAVSMESVDTQGGNIFGQVIPKVTAGTIFLGEFDAFAALKNPMATTSFGVMFDRKPLEVNGYFKYTAGTEFYNANGELQTDVKDECSLAAVLYEVESEDETLDGSNIYTSDKIVAVAQMTNGGQAEYAPFNLTLEYVKDYDTTKMYKFAIIFSASKDGAAYSAAVGSKLIVDEVTVICE